MAWRFGLAAVFLLGWLIALLPLKMVTIAAGGMAALPFGWKTPDLYGIGLLALTGVLQGVGQYFLVIAFRFGEVAVLGPFRYFNLVWAVIYGFLFFGDVPQRDMVIGASVVVGSGLFILWRETQLKRRNQS